MATALDPGASARSGSEDPTDANTAYGGYWQGAWRSQLARRVSMLAILCGTLVAILMTGIQLYVDYRSDLGDLTQSVQRIEQAVVPGLTESLWIVDETLVRSQLNGILQIDGIDAVEVIEPDGNRFVAGIAAENIGYWHVLPLSRPSGEEVIFLGTLRLHVTYQIAIKRLVRRGVLLLATNALKAFLVACCLLLIFHALVGRHLSQIAAFARTYHPTSPPGTLTLDRPPKAGQADELNDVENALNRTIVAIRQHVVQLEDANEVIATHVTTLEQANQHLLNANREQAEFTYAISHDLKSPSNTMGMLIDGLFEDASLGQEGRDILRDMRATNQRMRQLVDDVLDYSRIVEGGFDVADVDLTVIVENVLQDLSADVYGAGAEVSSPSLPCVPGHAMQLRLLFQNLIGNAIKFRSPARVPRIEITASETEETVSVTIADNGIGIPVQHYDRVFGLFQRLHAHSAYEGTGLGLTICRRVMANHRGTIEPGPGSDGGTAFKMTFRKVWDDETDQARGSD